MVYNELNKGTKGVPKEPRRATEMKKMNNIYINLVEKIENDEELVIVKVSAGYYTKFYYEPVKYLHTTKKGYISFITDSGEKFQVKPFFDKWYCKEEEYKMVGKAHEKRCFLETMEFAKQAEKYVEGEVLN